MFDRHHSFLRSLATRLLLPAAAIAGSWALPATATTSVPSPSNSTLPACLATTPGGNIPSVFIVRDLANNTIAGSVVVLDYSQCAGFVPCPQTGVPADNYIVDIPTQTVRAFTNVAGQVSFALRAGGGCSNPGIRVFADGVMLGTLHAASADQNGDLSVDGADVALVNGKIGSTDLSGDLNCDFIVDASDQNLVAGYVGVNCLNPTDTRRTTWGRIKTIYR